MLKTTRSSEELAPKVFRPGNNEVLGDRNGRANEIMRNLSKSKKLKNNKSRNLTCVPIIGAMREPIFLNPGARKAFKYLKQAFIKAPILQHFDLESYIRIKTNVLGYAIGEVLSQLSFY